MSNDTYIKLFRKSLNNDLFNEKPFDRWHAFEYLLLRAQRFPKDVTLNGQVVHLETGQLIESTESLAEKWGWSRGKVRRFLDLLKRSGIVHAVGTANGTAITIEKYAFYQDGRPANGTADGTADGTHKKKVKESKRNSFASQDIKPGGAAYKEFPPEKPVNAVPMPEELKDILGGIRNGSYRKD